MDSVLFMAYLSELKISCEKGDIQDKAVIWRMHHVMKLMAATSLKARLSLEPILSKTKTEEGILGT